MKDFGKTAVSLSKTPLGIIALAFVFIYAIAALVCSSSILIPDERKIIIWFLVLFPVFIMLIFYLLVSRHAKHLYSPGDFTSDEYFLKYASDSKKLSENDFV